LTEAPGLTFKIIRDADAPTRFRWLVYDGSRVIATSRESYGTRREAEASVGKTMIKLACHGGI
jgi:uncharacterized protein YegP (UPF0339 family)